jgi:hypothetical protein
MPHELRWRGKSKHENVIPTSTCSIFTKLWRQSHNRSCKTKIWLKPGEVAWESPQLALEQKVEHQVKSWAIIRS